MPKTDQLTEIAPCVHTYSWVKIGKFISRVTTKIWWRLLGHTSNISTMRERERKP